MVNNFSSEPYNDGFSAGILSRKREKHKEISGSEFSPVIPRDIWKERLTRNMSIRAYKSKEVLYSHLIGYFCYREVGSKGIS